MGLAMNWKVIVDLSAAEPTSLSPEIWLWDMLLKGDAEAEVT